MIASGRSPRLNPARRRHRYRVAKRLAPMARSLCRIGQCAIPIDLNDGPAALLYRKLTTPSLPDGAAALTASAQAPISNPHR